MSFGVAPPEVLDDRRISRDARWLYVLLDSYCDKNKRFCDPSQETLAQRLGCSTRSLRTFLRELESSGHVRIKRTWKSNKSFNQYLLRPATDFRSKTSDVVSDSGSTLPVQTKQTSDRKQTAGESGSILPVTPEADCRLRLPVKAPNEGHPPAPPKGGTTTIEGKQQQLITEDEPKPRLRRRKPVPFVPPTLDEMRAYATERGRPDLAEACHAHHQTRGWLLPGNREMKDWKGAFVTWQIKDVKFNGPPQVSPDRQRQLDEERRAALDEERRANAWRQQ